MGSSTRAAIDAFVDAVNRRDVEAAVSVCHRDVEFSSVLAALDGRPFRGHEGIREYFRQVDAAWQEWRVEVEQTHVRGDRVAVIFTMHVRGRGSGAGGAQRVGHVWELRDAHLWRCTAFGDPADALTVLAQPGAAGPVDG